VGRASGTWFTPLEGRNTSPGNGNEKLASRKTTFLFRVLSSPRCTPSGLIVFTTNRRVFDFWRGLPSCRSSPSLDFGNWPLSYNALDVKRKHASIWFTGGRANGFARSEFRCHRKRTGPLVICFLLLIRQDVYVTWHVSGSADKALYVADGSTGWYPAAIRRRPRIIRSPGGMESEGQHRRRMPSGANPFKCLRVASVNF